MARSGEQLPWVPWHCRQLSFGSRNGNRSKLPIQLSELDEVRNASNFEFTHDLDDASIFGLELASTRGFEDAPTFELEHVSTLDLEDGFELEHASTRDLEHDSTFGLDDVPFSSQSSPVSTCSTHRHISTVHSARLVLPLSRLRRQ